MSPPTHSFTRLVIGLPPNPPDHALKFGVEFANSLHLDLLGLFVEDAHLRQLTGLPFARELRGLGGGWQPLEPDRLLHELELAARRTRRLFAEAVKLLGTAHRFEVIRGDAKETIASVSKPGDILMLAEPSSAAERATHQFLSFRQAVFQSAASIMFAPPQPKRTEGPIVVLASPGNDKAVEAAAAIAARLGADLITIGIDDLSGDPGLESRRVRVNRHALSDPRTLVQVLAGLQERMLVVPQGDISEENARAIVSLRRVPILIVR